MIRPEPFSVTHVAFSFRVAARLSPALFILAQAGCSSDGGLPLVEPVIEPAVATSLAAIGSVTLSANIGAAVSPSVIVKDQRGAGMGGVAVTFAVASGGGSVAGASATTNSAGIATVGSWILGEVPGLNALTASAAGLPSVTFEATGTVKPCSPVVVTFEFGTTTNGTLGPEDCLSDAVFTDFYSTTPSGAGAYLFKLSATFDAYLYLGTSNFFNDFNGLIADNNNESSATTNSAIKALLPAGSYVVAATSWNWYGTGAYSLSSVTSSSDVSGCEQVYIVPGVSTLQNIQTTDCVRTDGPAYADQFFVYLKAGQFLTLSMASTAVDSFLELYFVDPTTGGRRPVAFNDNVDTSGTKDARLVYNPTTAGYYVILARTALNGETGAYTLTVQ